MVTTASENRQPVMAPGRRQHDAVGVSSFVLALLSLMFGMSSFVAQLLAVSGIPSALAAVFFEALP